jgi:hypothetical protein
MSHGDEERRTGIFPREHAESDQSHATLPTLERLALRARRRHRGRLASAAFPSTCLGPRAFRSVRRTHTLYLPTQLRNRNASVRLADMYLRSRGSWARIFASAQPDLRPHGAQISGDFCDATEVNATGASPWSRMGRADGMGRGGFQCGVAECASEISSAWRRVPA